MTNLRRFATFFRLLDKYLTGVYYALITSRGKKYMDEKCCACVQRTKERTPEEYRKLINRLSRIEGQIRGIKGMVEKSAYCPEILIQCSAVTAAMNAFNRELLASHIRSCVLDDIRAGREGTIDELLATLQKLMK